MSNKQFAIPSVSFAYDRIKIFSSTVQLCLCCDPIPYDKLCYACHNLAVSMSDYVSAGGKRSLDKYDDILYLGEEAI